ncbi:winged helix-turn-helix domain-containing protein [Haloarculaceae archaeon H-GB11]|nr:winged helix-turn-helix domain-containing protein [Haloarculaceae archaeon H-GB11]
MTPVDRAILERLENKGNTELVLTPGVIAENTDWSRQAVREHIMELRDHGLVEYYDEDRAIYQLTERARSYLRGDLDVEELESDDE